MAGQNLRQLKGRKVLVTGGFGFIGRHIVLELQGCGAKVDILGLVARPELFPDPTNLTFIEADLTKPGPMSFFEEEDYDFIIHLAGSSEVWPSIENPISDLRLNTESTLRILEVLRKKKKKPFFVYASSIGVYGSQPKPIDEETVPRPASPYGINKLSADLYTGLYARENETYGLPTVRIRYSSAYGPGLRKLFVCDMMKKIHKATIEGSAAEIRGSGKQVRDFNYVEDHARATVRILKKAQFKGEIYNVGSGRGYSLMEIAKWLREALGSDCTISPTKEDMTGDVKQLVYTNRKMKSLGYEPKTDIRSGLWKAAWSFKSDFLKDNRMGKVSVIIPTYNERDNVRAVIERIEPYLRPHCKEHEIIFVDDSSPDGTAEEVRMLAEEKASIKLIVRGDKEGLGGAQKAGLDAATGDILIILDADCSQDPATIVDFLYGLSMGADMVIGSRFMPGGKIVNQPFPKRYASTTANILTRAILKKDIQDLTHSYRAIKKPAYDKIKTHLKEKYHPGFCLELTLFALNAGFKVIEVPTTFTERTVGTTKLKIGDTTLRFIKKIIVLKRTI